MLINAIKEIINEQVGAVDSLNIGGLNYISVQDAQRLLEEQDKDLRQAAYYLNKKTFKIKEMRYVERDVVTAMLYKKFNLIRKLKDFTPEC